MKKSVFEFTDTNFKEEVLNSKIPVLVDFWAEWCGPCKVMMPVIEELAAKFHGKFKIGKLNVDENPDTIEKASVMNIPTIVFFKGGEEVNRVVGINPKEKIVKEIEGLI